MSGGGFFQWGNGSLQSSNLTQQLIDLKIPESPLIKSYDVNGSVGGPIKKDRVWYFATVRGQGNSAYLPIYYNKNAGDPTKWLYEPDTSRQAFNDKTWQNGSARITTQLTPRNKLNLFWDEQDVCRSCENGGNYANGTTSPEGNGYGDLRPMRFQSVNWSSPVSNKLLLEGGFGYFFSRWGGRAKEDPYTGNLVRIIEQCSAGCAANGNIPSLMYRSQTTDLFSDGRNKNITTTWRFTASYVTGASSLKFGYIGNQLGDLRSANRSPNDLRYRTNNGVPNQLTEYVHDQQNDLWMSNHALFVQEQWTRGRLTVQGGLRYDRAASWAPEQHLESRFWQTALDFAETPVVDSYKDITPRAARRLRPVRQRQDGAQGDLRQVRRIDGHGVELLAREPHLPHRDQRDAHLDRRQRQLESRLRPEELRAAGSPRRRRRLLRRHQQPELRHVDLQQHDRSRRSCTAGASGRRTGTGACRCSTKCCRGCRSMSASSTARSTASP